MRPSSRTSPTEPLLKTAHACIPAREHAHLMHEGRRRQRALRPSFAAWSERVQLFFTMSTTDCTLWALFASMPFSSSVSGISTIFSTPLPPMMQGTPMKRSL